MEVEYLRLGELFSGPGGLAKGALEAESEGDSKILRIRHAWANDLDPSSCQTYSYNICGKEDSDSVICGDVKNLDLNALGQIDLFAFGFPCNDFSIVGKQKGFHGEYGALYSYGVQIMNIYKPKAFIAENVGGIISANEGKAFKQILEDLQNSGDGYNLTVHKYKSEEYGVPQTRHRYIIVGIDKSLGLKYRVPATTNANNYVTAREALSGIPENALNNELKKMSERVVRRLEHIRPGENAWTAVLPEDLKLNVKSARMSQIYKRLDPDLPSYTITGSGGGGTHGYHYDEPRALTNRERARIQTFQDDYRFFGGIEKVRRQIGMAVPPKLSKIIFTALLNTLNEVPYAYIEPNYNISDNLWSAQKSGKPKKMPLLECQTRLA